MRMEVSQIGGDVSLQAVGAGQSAGGVRGTLGMRGRSRGVGRERGSAVGES